MVLVQGGGSLICELSKTESVNAPNPPWIEERIEQYASRVERGLDIWSGLPTTEARALVKEMRWRKRTCKECGCKFIGAFNREVCFGRCVFDRANRHNAESKSRKTAS